MRTTTRHARHDRRAAPSGRTMALRLTALSVIVSLLATAIVTAVRRPHTPARVPTATA